MSFSNPCHFLSSFFFYLTEVIVLIMNVTYSKLKELIISKIIVKRQKTVLCVFLVCLKVWSRSQHLIINSYLVLFVQDERAAFDWELHYLINNNNTERKREEEKDRRVVAWRTELKSWNGQLAEGGIKCWRMRWREPPTWNKKQQLLKFCLVHFVLLCYCFLFVLLFGFSHPYLICFNDAVIQLKCSLWWSKKKS